jgi:uncharacterized RDD family membrane protein YckC
MSASTFMNCPKCQSTEIDSGGFCLVCGLRAYPPEEIQNREVANRMDVAAPNDATNPDAAVQVSPAELPEWRQELSRRLQEIKSRREVSELNPPVPPAAFQTEAQRIQERAVHDPAPVPPRQPGPRKPRRTPRPAIADQAPDAAAAPEKEPSISSHAVKTQPESQKVEEAHEGYAASDIIVRPSVEDVEARRQQYTQELIDTVVAKLAVRDQPAPASPVQELEPAPESRPERKPEPRPETALATKLQRMAEAKPDRKSEPAPKAGPQPLPEIRPVPSLAPQPVRETEVTRALLGEPRDSRLILLSRTLAGLVDLIVVFLSAGLMIVTVDILEGIEVFDTMSKIHYALLFLVIYFVYSVFFLGMAGQTIGMMLTDLRLVGASAGRPSMAQLLVRCGSFLVSLALLGIGLLWGCFDNQTRCLHDHLSQTRVVRISQD